MKKSKTYFSKIVDTIPNFGHAESYITYSAGFTRFLRNKYNVKEIKEIDLFEIVKKYNLKGIVFGNYVSQEERYFFLFKTSKQLELLAKIKGNNNLGLGLLIISFGSQGIVRSLAHFNPTKCLINLNRGRKSDYTNTIQGEDSFVHEYGHFLDFVFGFRNATFNENFASDAHRSVKDENINNILSVVRTAQDNKEYMRSLSTYSNAAYLEKPIEIFARLFEATITHIVNQKYKDYKRFFERDYKEDIYFEKDLIFKHKIDKDIIKSLKNLSLTEKQKQRFAAY